MMSATRSELLKQARAVAATWAMSASIQSLLRAEAPGLAEDLDDLRELATRVSLPVHSDGVLRTPGGRG